MSAQETKDFGLTVQSEELREESLGKDLFIQCTAIMSDTTEARTLGAIKDQVLLCMVACTHSPSIWDAGTLVEIQGNSTYIISSRPFMGYNERPCHKYKNKGV